MNSTDKNADFSSIYQSDNNSGKICKKKLWVNGCVGKYDVSKKRAR